MSIYSTMDITAEDAKELIIKGAETLIRNVGSLSEDELKDALFFFYADKTYNNFSIVENYVPVDKFGGPLQYKNNEGNFIEVSLI